MLTYTIEGSQTSGQRITVEQRYADAYMAALVLYTFRARTQQEIFPGFTVVDTRREQNRVIIMIQPNERGAERKNVMEVVSDVRDVINRISRDVHPIALAMQDVMSDISNIISRTEGRISKVARMVESIASGNGHGDRERMAA